MLDLSMLSGHVRDSLAKSLNESRRLSMSFGPNSSFAGIGDISLAQASFGALGRIAEHEDDAELDEPQNQDAEEPVPDFKIPVISIKVNLYIQFCHLLKSKSQILILVHTILH